MSYIGNPPVVQATRLVSEVIATAGQTTFLPAGGYVPGNLDVEVNGVSLLSGDYVATDGVSVVLNQACGAGDEVRFVAFGIFQVANVNGAAITNGTVTLPKLAATGTPNNTNFLRGDGQWVTPPAGFSGAQNITSATNVTLTAQSPQTLNINMTAAGRNVILPNATTLTAGGDVFRIYNNGVYPFSIFTSTGAPVVENLTSFNGRALTLVFNSTPTGGWSVSNISGAARVLPIGAPVQEAFNNSRILRLSATRFFAVTGGITSGGGLAVNSNTNSSVSLYSITARIGTLSGNTITWGSPQTFTGEGGLGSFFVVNENLVLMGNTALWSTGNGQTTNLRVYWRGFAISGNTITAATQVQAFSGSGSTYPYAAYWIAGPFSSHFFVPETNTCVTVYGFTRSNFRGMRVSTVDSSGNVALGTQITNQAIGSHIIDFGGGVVMASISNGTNPNSPTSSGSAIVTFNSGSYSVGTLATGQTLIPDDFTSLRAQIKVDANTVRARQFLINRSGTTALARTNAFGTLIGAERYLGGTVVHQWDGNSIQFISGNDVSASGGSSLAQIGGETFKLDDTTVLIITADGGPLRYQVCGVA